MFPQPEAAQAAVRASWSARLNAVTVQTPDAEFDAMQARHWKLIDLKRKLTALIQRLRTNRKKLVADS